MDLEFDSLQRYLGGAMLRVAALQRRAGEADGKNGRGFDQAVRELESAIEELSTAHEELRSMNEALLQARQRVEEESARYRELFDSFPDPCIITDGDGAIVTANEAAISLLNLSPKFIAGKPLAIFVERDRREFLRLVCDVRETGQVRDFELHVRPRERAPLVVNGIASPVRSTPAAGVRWLFRDVDRLRRRKAAALAAASSAPGGET